MAWNLWQAKKKKKKKICSREKNAPLKSENHKKTLQKVLEFKSMEDPVKLKKNAVCNFVVSDVWCKKTLEVSQRNYNDRIASMVVANKFISHRAFKNSNRLQT